MKSKIMQQHPSDTLNQESVWGQWCQTVENYGDHDFLHIPKTSNHPATDLTYKQAHVLVLDVLSAYQSAGYDQEQHVVLAMDNRPEAFIHFIALNALGVLIIPLNTGLETAEMGYILKDSECSLVVSLSEHVSKIKSALKEVAHICSVLTPDGLQALPAQKAANALPSLSRHDAAAMIYTSGTTGMPKGCVLSNEYLLTTGSWYANIGGYLEIGKGCERILTPLPLFHVNALCYTFMMAISTGNCLIQLDRFHASTWWSSVRDTKATALHYLGVMPAILLLAPPKDSDDFSTQIRFAFGAGVDPKHHQIFEDRFGFPLVEGWAMTETGAAACMMVHDEPRHIGKKCIGRVPAYLDYCFIDAEGAPVPSGEDGELLIRSKGDNPKKGFFSEYFKNETATTEAWANGWFHTGDVMREETDGSLFFVERRKNIIRRSGENIAAGEVESVLLAHPDISNCVVAPVHDEICGEEVMVLVQLQDGKEPTSNFAEALLKYAGESLVYYKIPAYVAFVDSLPTMQNQKVQRRSLNVLCSKHIEDGSAHDLRQMKRNHRRNS